MMILDIEKFIAREKPLWKELEDLLDALSKSDSVLTMEEAKRFFYLYERVSEDLTKVSTFSGERELRKYLEMLVSKAYSNIYSQKKKRVRFYPLKIITVFFPAAFRRNIKHFYLACAVTFLGLVFGALAVTVDNGAKKAIFPEEFQHLQQSPDERVKQEEQANGARRPSGQQSSFADSQYPRGLYLSCAGNNLGHRDNRRAFLQRCNAWRSRARLYSGGTDDFYVWLAFASWGDRDTGLCNSGTGGVVVGIMPHQTPKYPQKGLEGKKGRYNHAYSRSRISFDMGRCR
jgi:hypothetical protein